MERERARKREMEIERREGESERRRACHDGSDFSLESTEEGRVVHLPPRALVHDFIAARTIRFLIVFDPVLCVGNHTCTHVVPASRHQSIKGTFTRLCHQGLCI